ncbi:MAG: PilZ domain-containing protein [Nitrospinae bacterium]|nr:PilZ domain-containing protein [Nitrospinota bacterium]
MAHETDAEPVPTSEPQDRGIEARRDPRLYEPFPVKVRGVDANGDDFDLNTVLDNFSAGGLYLRLPQRLEPGAKVFAVVRLTTQDAPGARVAVRGRVRCLEPKPDGGCGVAIQFTRHRFL